MFITGGGEIQSIKGTTQGDPIGVAMYALPITPLIRQLHDKCAGTSQVWFADDASAAGKCCKLRQWSDKLYSLGLKYIYMQSEWSKVLPYCKGAL